MEIEMEIEMECIRKHKSELFNRNVNLMHAIKRVLDKKNIYLTSSINIMIKQQSELAATHDTAAHDTAAHDTATHDTATHYTTSQELQNEFWNYYIELFGTSDNIPVSQAIKPRRSH
jgi:hypothetical protein